MGNILSDAPNRANPVVGVGQFIAWNGGCIFIGRHDSQIPVHAHQAIQLVAGRSAKARVHTAEQAPWIEHLQGEGVREWFGSWPLESSRQW